MAQRSFLQIDETYQQAQEEIAENENSEEFEEVAVQSVETEGSEF